MQNFWKLNIVPFLLEGGLKAMGEVLIVIVSATAL